MATPRGIRPTTGLPGPGRVSLRQFNDIRPLTAAQGRDAAMTLERTKLAGREHAASALRARKWHDGLVRARHDNTVRLQTEANDAARERLMRIEAFDAIKAKDCALESLAFAKGSTDTRSAVRQAWTAGVMARSDRYRQLAFEQNQEFHRASVSMNGLRSKVAMAVPPTKCEAFGFPTPPRREKPTPKYIPGRKGKKSAAKRVQ